MESLEDRLDNIRIRVKVPGVEIFAELHHRDQVTISFGSDVYGWVSERDLERHMGSLARLLFVAWTRQYHASLSEEFRQHVLSGPENQADRDYLEARGEIVSFGRSSDGRVSVAARGMQDVRVQIADGTFHTLNEHDFVEQTREAVMALAKDHMNRISELKLRFYP